MNINFSTATRGKLHTAHIVPRWELIPCFWVKRCASFSQAPQEEFSLSTRDVRPPVQMRWKRMVSLGSPQGIQTCLHLVRWKTSLNLSHCREILYSFESWPLGVHSNWDRKHRVPLPSLLLMENSSWGACGKWLTSSVKDRESALILGRYGVHGALRVAVLKLIFI